MNNIVKHIPSVRRAPGVNHPVALTPGSQLSTATPATMGKLKQVVQQHHCVVFTVNKFAYGPFPGTRVKEKWGIR